MRTSVLLFVLFVLFTCRVARLQCKGQPGTNKRGKLMGIEGKEDFGDAVAINSTGKKLSRCRYDQDRHLSRTAVTTLVPTLEDAMAVEYLGSA